MTGTKAVLVLEDGVVYTGTAFGALGQSLGEAVFSTGMSGYQETLTDPSYHRQIVIATAPQIGNTGWNQPDGESRDDKIWVAGYVVRDPSPRVSNWRATGTLEDELIRQNIVGIAGVDTRAVVRHLRTRGSMRAGVFSGPALAEGTELLRRVCEQPAMLGADLCGEVSTDSSYVVEAQGPQRFTVVALDLGIKTNTPRNFAQRGIRTHVLPSSATFEQIADLAPDGVFLSNGPGDPATADRVVGVTREILGAGIVLGSVFLCDEEDLLVVAHHRFECAHGFIPADKERHNHVREDHDIAQRQHREQIAAFKFRHMTSLRTVGAGFAQKRHEARRHGVA